VSGRIVLQNQARALLIERSPGGRAPEVSKLDSALEPSFGLLVAKIRFLLQTAPFSLSIPSFGSPHVLADVCAASLGGCWVCA
jgi:hypothetical protein